ncbi:nuclear transport factor 2 family protein [Roseibium album]|uniref:SnoaL-like domain protein n=1 Tax=Roseibium album TaxID=311410 RepID=A0A0M6ZDP5_9HYPH|nr:nuclear transport factor 2 family protein [Roseibium album]CTQ60300.1 SnoaL-like domain protein [Roseibium album]CTQ66592.1 SnoaL-like domain protein [Roseibium album]CTQ74408.1 SnoaL-like domain protein [Roseibium album]
MHSLSGTNKVHHAKGLYLDGIRDGKVWEALNAHTGARYTQHSTGVGDGQKGFAEFFGPFLERNPVRQIEVIRAIEDGSFVFLHVFQSLNNGESKWVTGDLFDTDETARVVEHWDVIQTFETRTKSGRTMTDGTTRIEDLHRTEANKALVRSFCDACLINGDFARAADFISANEYLQHNPDAADGLDGLAGLVSDLAARGETMRYWKFHKLIGQGNFVVTLSHMQMGRSHYCVFDIFRLQEGRIVEHWDVTEKILAPEEWNNQGKF